MVIGAQCRDLLHEAFGRADRLRSTSDVDIALAVEGYAEYQRVTSRLPPSGSTGIRYSIAGITVDVVPFGDIENPAGTTALPGRREPLDVFGFQEVFDRSIVVPTPIGHHIHLPTPAGYTALKLKAWCDRSVNGEYKDATDIATACGWYQDDETVRESLYGPDAERVELLIRADMDADVASLYLLGQEISSVLGDTRVAELAAAWTLTDQAMLTEYFARERCQYIQGVRTGRPTYQERPVSSPAAQRGREVRRRLLTAATQLIPERGWTAVSTRNLAERAGVTPSVVHYHFPSLQALLREAVTAALSRAAAELEALFDTAETADGLVDALLAGVDSFAGQEATSLLLVEAYLAATRDDALREAIESTLSATRRRLAHRLADSGVADAEATATVLLATLDGLVLYHGLGVTPGGPAGVLKRLVADPGERETRPHRSATP